MRSNGPGNNLAKFLQYARNAPSQCVCFPSAGVSADTTSTPARTVDSASDSSRLLDVRKFARLDARHNPRPPLPFTLRPCEEEASKKRMKDRFSKRVYENARHMEEQMALGDDDVANAYRCEQKSEEWFQYRMDRLTGSSFGSAAGHNPHQKPDQLLHSMLWGEFEQSRHTIHGSFYEDEARQAYVLYKLLTLASKVQTQAGFVSCDFTNTSAQAPEVVTAGADAQGKSDTTDAARLRPSVPQVIPSSACWYDDMPSCPSSSKAQNVTFDEPPLDPTLLAQSQNAHMDEASAIARSAPYYDEASNKIMVPFRCWECGIMLRKDLWYIGCSPDGLVEECGDEGCLEIKCPSSKRDFYVNDPRYASTGIPPYYYDQIQGLMHFSNRKWCDFVVYVVVPDSCERKMWIRRYFYEKQYCESVLFPKIKDFYFKRYVPLRIAQCKGLLPHGSVKLAAQFNRNAFMAFQIPLPAQQGAPATQPADSTADEHVASSEREGTSTEEQTEDAPVEVTGGLVDEQIQNDTAGQRAREDGVDIASAPVVDRVLLCCDETSGATVDADDKSGEGYGDGEDLSDLRYFLVMDLEATGLSVSRDKITQMCCVFVQCTESRSEHGEYKVLSVFNNYVNPERHIPDNVQQLTGITDARVKDEPVFEYIWRDFCEWSANICQEHACKQCALVAHNGFAYDFRMLRAHVDCACLNSMYLSYNQWMSVCSVRHEIDTMLAARQVHASKWSHELRKTASGNPSYTLSSVYAAVFDSSFDNAHDALGDTLALVRACFDSRSPLRFHLMNPCPAWAKTVVANARGIATRKRNRLAHAPMPTVSAEGAKDCEDDCGHCDDGDDGDIKSVAARAIQDADSWETLTCNLKSVNCEVRPTGGGLTLWTLNPPKRVCKSSELGCGYLGLVRRFRKAMPGHTYPVQHVVDRSVREGTHESENESAVKV